MSISSRPSSPIAAIGLILAVLAIGGLARSPDRPPPAPLREIVVKGESVREAAELREAGPMDLNRASAADLELLPRIGPALAARIVEDRRTNGPFGSVQELTRVRGIGPGTLAQVRDNLRVGEGGASGGAADDR